jgi:hypothetical protein
MYGLIHNNKIQVGPREWSYWFFKKYLNDNNLTYSQAQLSISDPGESVIGDGWKILKTSIDVPSYNSLFEQLEGPFWTINANDITGYYNVIDVSVASAKNNMKSIVAANRYIVEIGGVDYTLADNTVVNLYTNREDRNAYLDAMLIIQPEDTITFKFKKGIFKPLTKADLQGIVGVGSFHIASVFNWEATKVGEIETTQTIAALKLIELRHPIQVEADNNNLNQYLVGD